MRPIAFLCFAAVLAGCTKAEDRTVGDASTRDTVGAAAETPAASAAISLADVAGKWNIRTMDKDGGNAVDAELLATADRSGWTLTLPNRKPVPMRVTAVAGDSFVTEAGPFESVLRKGVQVRTRTVNRLQDGKLVGIMEARYAMGGRDSVALRLSEGTRKP
jgi:hypothetical protein